MMVGSYVLEFDAGVFGICWHSPMATRQRFYALNDTPILAITMAANEGKYFGHNLSSSNER